MVEKESKTKTGCMLLDTKTGGKFSEFLNKLKAKIVDLSSEDLLIKHLEKKKPCSYLIVDKKKLTDKILKFLTENVEISKELMIFFVKLESENDEFVEPFKKLPSPPIVKVVSKTIAIENFEKAIFDAEMDKANCENTTTSDLKDESTRYKFIKLLGAGQEGIVNLYQDTFEGKLVAVKTCSMKDIKEIIKAQIREKEKLAIELKSPTIIEFYKVVEEFDDRHIYIEFATGGTLKDYLLQVSKTGEVLSSDVILDWFVQILIAIYSLHSKNLSHRDIKPENILLCENPFAKDKDEKKTMIAKISDLGISKVIEGTAKNTVIGTPHYVAPEVISDLPYNKNVDLWSLAIMTYEMALRRRPFQELNTEALNNEIITSNVQNNFPTNFDFRLKYVLERLMKKNPASRLTLKELFALDFIRERVDTLLFNFSEWRVTYKELFDDILSIDILPCPYNPKFVLEEELRLIETSMKLMELTQPKSYKKSFLGGKIENSYTGSDIQTYFQDNFNDNTSNELISKLLRNGLLVNVSNPNDTEAEELQDNDYYVFSFDSHGMAVDNLPFGQLKGNTLLSKNSLLRISEKILNLAKLLEIVLVDESKTLDLSNVDYMNFLFGISLFRKFSLLDINKHFTSSEERHAFLLNLYQIMFFNNLIKEKLEFKKKRNILASLIKNDISVNYAFSDCTLNNLEFRHGLFRDNQKPLENYLRICSGNDSRFILTKDLKLGVQDLIIVCELISLSLFSENANVYTFKVFSDKNFQEQRLQYMIDFSNNCMEIEEDEIRLPPQYQKYFELDLKGSLGLITSVVKSYQHHLEAESKIMQLEYVDSKKSKYFFDGNKKILSKIKNGSIKIVFE